MKKLLLAGMLLIGAVQVSADMGSHVLICEERPYEQVSIYLNEQGRGSESSVFRVVGGQVIFNYSATISVACDSRYYGKDGADTLECSGYYHSGDLTTFTVARENGKIFVDWTTSANYGREGLRTECQIKKNRGVE